MILYIHIPVHNTFHGATVRAAIIIMTQTIKRATCTTCTHSKRIVPFTKLTVPFKNRTV